MATSIKFRKVAPSRYGVYVGEDVSRGTFVGTVYDNGARATYGRNWTARSGDGWTARTSSRGHAAELLIQHAREA